MLRRTPLVLVAFLLLVASARAQDAKKPKVFWLTKLPDALDAAKREWKPILLKEKRDT